MFDRKKFDKYYDFQYKKEPGIEWSELKIGKKNGPMKFVGPMGRNPLFLGFGNNPNVENYADGFLAARNNPNIMITSAKEMIMELGGISEDEFCRTYYKYDLRTENFLNACLKNLGFLFDDVGWAEYKYELLEKTNFALNTSDLEIGKYKGIYIATYGMRTDIDDYANFNLFFDRKPSLKTINDITTIEDIRNHLEKYDDYIFNCWECGCKRHWLDINPEQNTLQARFENLKEHYDEC